MDLRDVLSEQDIDALRTSNNWAGARIIAFDWSMIIGTFWITAQFPNPLTIALAVILLGGRQLALGIIVHETGHRSLFTDQPVNDFCGNWLAGYWVFSDKGLHAESSKTPPVRRYARRSGSTKLQRLSSFHSQSKAQDHSGPQRSGWLASHVVHRPIHCTLAATETQYSTNRNPITRTQPDYAVGDVRARRSLAFPALGHGVHD